MVLMAENVTASCAMKTKTLWWSIEDCMFPDSIRTYGRDHPSYNYSHLEGLQINKELKCRADEKCGFFGLVWFGGDVCLFWQVQILVLNLSFVPLPLKKKKKV